jgi:hypothetical protein
VVEDEVAAADHLRDMEFDVPGVHDQVLVAQGLEAPADRLRALARGIPGMYDADSHGNSDPPNRRI